MRFYLYIDKKYTVDGIRVYVKFLSDSSGYNAIFLTRIDRILTAVDRGVIPIYIFGHKSASFNMQTVSYIQGRGIFESVVTPNYAIGAGSPYQKASHTILKFVSISESLSADLNDCYIKFPSYVYQAPIWAYLEVPVIPNGDTYKTILDNNKVKLEKVLDAKLAKVDIDLPSNLGEPIDCEIIKSETEKITGKCIVQSSLNNADSINIPNPYIHVLQNSAVAVFDDSATALAFVNSIKADVQNYINKLKEIGNIQGVEMVTYEV